MSDLDFEKLMGAGIPQGQAEAGFRARLKQASGQALVRGRQRRLWYKRAGLTCVALLVTMSAFWSGRVSVKSRAPRGSMAVSELKQDANSILVTRDLVTWLEAARFFERLGMEERASKAYQLASTLTPSTENQDQRASKRAESRFTNPVDTNSTLNSLLARYDACIGQEQETIESVPLIAKRKRLTIIAQFMGGTNHDH